MQIFGLDNNVIVFLLDKGNNAKYLQKECLFLYKKKKVF